MTSRQDEDLSLESTFPTDISISQDDNSELQTTEDDPTSAHRWKQIPSFKNKRSNGIEQKLRHELLKLNIVFKEKSLKFDSLKSESSKKIESLENALEESNNNLQILQMQSQLQKQEMISLKGELEHKLSNILATQNILQATSTDIQRTLSCVSLTEQQYQQLLVHQGDDLSLTDFLAMKLYEKEIDWKQENSLLKSRIKILSDERIKYLETIDKLKNDLDLETRQKYEYESKLQRTSNVCETLQNDIQTGNYKIDNFDKIFREKEDYFQRMEDALKELSVMKISNSHVYKERDDLNLENTVLKQTIVLLTKDKDYFNHQISDLNNKLLLYEDKLSLAEEQVEKSKRQREELYEKYITSRDQYKKEYDEKLCFDLNQIKSQTNVEIERLKSNTKELYERENRSLREAKDNAISEKERALFSEKETHDKYEQLLQDFRQQQLASDSKISDAFNEVKIKTFESQRSQLLYEENMKNLKDSQIMNEKLQKKLEVVTREFYSMQSSLDKKVSELETINKEKSIKLETYEKLEQELDDVILQAAESKSEADADRVLFSYGYGANIPTTAKRRLKQSVHLTQRVLQLERANTSLRNELENELFKSKQYAEEVRSSNQLLNDARQPQHYLVESIRQRDLLVGQLKQQVEELEKELKKLKTEKSELIKSKNMATLDLERLLNHEEEMTMMKQIILGLKDDKSNKLNYNNKSDFSTNRRSFQQAEREENATYRPPSIQFTKTNRRLNQLKQNVSKDPTMRKFKMTD